MGKAYLKNLFLIIFVFFLVNSIWGVEKIISFNSYIVVNIDGSLHVKETIKVNCEGKKIRRGIYRDFPTVYYDTLGIKHKVKFNITGVKKDGIPEEYHVEHLRNGVRVYIGRKDYFLQPQIYTYTIEYLTDRQVGFFDDYDELYWNVTGNNWEFEIEYAQCEIELPQEARKYIIELDAWTGPAGGRRKDFQKKLTGTGIAGIYTTKSLFPGDGLTVVFCWEKGFIREPSTSEKIILLIKDNKSVFVGFSGLIILLVFYLVVWYKFGRDPEKGVVIPLYEAPSKLSPSAVRFIYNMGYDNKCLASALINMAVKGVIKIDEETDDYIIKYTGKEIEILSDDEKEIFKKLFSDRDTLVLKQSNYEVIRSVIKSHEESLRNSYEKNYFVTNKNYFVTGVLLSIITVLISIFLEGISSYRVPSIFLIFFIITFSVILIPFIYKFFNTIRRLFIKGLLFARIRVFIEIIFSGVFLAGFIFIFSMIFSLDVFLENKAIFIIILLCVIINLFFYQLLKAPTLAGRVLLDKIEGFKKFLVVAEKDRFSILVPPEKNIEVFEKNLPYALALDVEHQWSDYFAEVVEQSAREGKEYKPAWYSGRRFSSRNFRSFSSSLGNSLSERIFASSTPPGSSSGRGSGRSGGGGGGGGGGGW